MFDDNNSATKDLLEKLLEVLAVTFTVFLTPRVGATPSGGTMQDHQPTAHPASSMPPPQAKSDNEALFVAVPAGQSGWAIAAGYLGAFSLLLWPLGFVAVLVSYKALSRRLTTATMLRIVTANRPNEWTTAWRLTIVPMLSIVTGFVGGAVGVGVSVLLLVSLMSS